MEPDHTTEKNIQSSASSWRNCSAISNLCPCVIYKLSQWNSSHELPATIDPSLLI